MQPGDSIFLDFINTGLYASGYYRLDSISTVIINAGPRQIYFLRQPSMPWITPVTWIESVGHPGHLVYTHSGNDFGGGVWCWDMIPRDFYQSLSCFEHYSQKIYFDSCAHANALNNWCFLYTDSCNYWNICSSLEENNIILSFELIPNPSFASTKLTIESQKHMKAEIELSDVYGRRIMKSEIVLFQGKNEHIIETDKLSADIYLVTLRSGSSAVSRKLIRMEE
jgi:hypothetical protein